MYLALALGSEYIHYALVVTYEHYARVGEAVQKAQIG